MNRTNSIITFLVLIALLPLWMLIAWRFTSRKKLVVAIIDKTVLTPKGQEHASLTWVLNNGRYAKNKHQLYNVSHDYYGFFPKDSMRYRIKGLERFTSDQLDQLSRDADILYCTDAYGIYRNEWYAGSNQTERSGIIYGGLSQQDVDLMERMKAAHKLVMAEFNCVGSPTAGDIEARFEQLFHIQWTGWTGRYFDCFDTVVNKELPHWLVRNYQAQHDGRWPFHKAGIALVSRTDEVIILEEGQGVSQPFPRLQTTAYGQSRFHLPRQLYYPFWFDIVHTDTAINTLAARFELDVTDTGRTLLMAKGLSASFPAVQEHKGADYHFTYFSADFSDNDISQAFSYFKGIHWFSFLFFNRLDPANRSGFFWRYYRPLVSTILAEYYKEKGR